MYIKCIKLSINYWCRLEKGTENFLLNETYNNVKIQGSWWLQGIYNMLKYNGYGNILLKNNINVMYGTIIEQRMKDIFIQNWFKKINTSEKLKHLSVLKSSYSKQNYFNKINNVTTRKQFIRLRTGSNYLKCGTLSKVVNKECEMCDTREVETVKHILLFCKKHERIRNELYKQVNICNKGVDEKLNFILNIDTNNKCYQQKVIQFIKEVCDAMNL